MASITAVPATTTGQRSAKMAHDIRDPALPVDGLPAPAGSPAARSRALAMLRASGLRPTRQRQLLAELLFAEHDRHVSAEALHAEALAKGEHVSLATVYNTLHQFRSAGLVRELAIDATRAYFDTNVSNHNHFFVEADGELLDIPSDQIRVDGLPEPPPGMRISHIDVVVRLVPDTD